VTTPARWPDPSITAALLAVRASNPLTFGLTNYISAQLAANVVLAAGGSPAIGGLPDGGAEHLASIAGGVWINLASVITDPPELLLSTAEAARDADTPWVFDPVTVGAGISANDKLAGELLARKPTVIRGNASEVIALAGGSGGAKGVDSTASTEQAVEYAVTLARRIGGVVAASGEVDVVTDGDEVVQVPGGHPWLAQVTATGCSLGALTAAFLGAGTQPLRATVAAHAVFAVAAERAATHARGTGSFAVALLDEISTLHTEL
jgi:hydroxyethylthiazole kinase